MIDFREVTLDDRARPLRQVDKGHQAQAGAFYKLCRRAASPTAGMLAITRVTLTAAATLTSARLDWAVG